MKQLLKWGDGIIKILQMWAVSSEGQEARGPDHQQTGSSVVSRDVVIEFLLSGLLTVITGPVSRLTRVNPLSSYSRARFPRLTVFMSVRYNKYNTVCMPNIDNAYYFTATCICYWRRGPTCMSVWLSTISPSFIILINQFVNWNELYWYSFILKLPLKYIILLFRHLTFITMPTEKRFKIWLKSISLKSNNRYNTISNS